MVACFFCPYAPKTVVREITGPGPMTQNNPHSDGAGAWIKGLGAEPIELDGGQTKMLDISEAIRKQYTQPQRSQIRMRIDLRCTPPQDCVGGVYRIAIESDGTMSAFENEG